MAMSMSTRPPQPPAFRVNFSPFAGELLARLSPEARGVFLGEVVPLLERDPDAPPCCRTGTFSRLRLNGVWVHYTVQEDEVLVSALGAVAELPSPPQGGEDSSDSSVRTRSRWSSE